MKRILIAGGAGFLGSHLTKRLLSEGNTVYCLDNFSTGSQNNLIVNDRLHLVTHNIQEPLDIEVDEIYNLASPASPKRYQLAPTDTIRSNILGAINLLELAKSRGARILQTSTAEVYGAVTFVPNQNVFNPRHCYLGGKQAVETLFYSYHAQHHVRVKIARLFNTYGPNLQVSDGRAIVNFIVQALRNETISINGNGEQNRNFCYASDTVDALIDLMATPDDFVGPVDVGNPETVTIRQLAERIVAVTGSTSTINYTGASVVEPVQPVPDLSLITETTGWTPKVSLDQGLEKTIEYFKTIIKGN
jgi:UDP-glucuronate decarboxylase